MNATTQMYVNQRLKDMAYRLGWMVGFENRPKTLNPYDSSNPIQRDEWQRGWERGKQKHDYPTTIK